MTQTSGPQTIYALSSGALPSGVAIIRISGSGVENIMKTMLGRVLEQRRAAYCVFRHPRTGTLLDEGLVLFFSGPGSFTGEDVLELHCHGGVATVDAILQALGSYPDLRAAERGEFSRRAFENGRLDLTELEGLADLISAQTETQRQLALAQSTGSLRKLYDDWRDQLIRCRALIEAELDFADEDDVPGSVSDGVWQSVKNLKISIENHLNDNRTGELVRSGFKIALLGAPNAGKSSLLNALAKRDVAIVTPEAGTTRDVIEVSLNIAGHLVIVSDTAGLRDADNAVEQEGIRRAHLAADQADLVLWLEACDDPVAKPKGLNAIVVHTKTDLVSSRNYQNLAIDTVSRDGISSLLENLEREIVTKSIQTEEPILTRQRHREALASTVSSLENALEPLEIELRSEYLRQAAESLGRITGRIDVEDLLDVIFSEFCVGK